MKIALWIIAVCELFRALQNLWQMRMMHIDMKMRKDAQRRLGEAERIMWEAINERTTEGDDRTDM